MDARIAAIIQSKCDPASLAKLQALPNEKLWSFLADAIELCQPDSVIVYDSSAADRAIVRKTVKAAGDRFDETIIRYLRRKYNMVLGERTAEELKLTIGAVVSRTEKLFMDVTGRNLVSGLPKTLRVHSDEIHEALEEPVQALVEDIHSVLERTPPELAADIFDHGMLLIGAGSQLFGLSESLSRQLKVNCRVAVDPQACVALGAGRAMESEGGYERAMFNSKRSKRVIGA